MDKHSQVNIDSNSKDIEHLLDETSNSSKYDVSNGYDTVRVWVRLGELFEKVHF